MPKQTAPNCGSARAASRYGQPGARNLPRILPLGCVALMFGSALAEAAENQALGRYLSAECIACHRLSGTNSVGIPSIVGWPEEQFAAVLDSYGRKERGGQAMQAVAARLSRAEIAALAAYFGALSPKP